MYTYKFLGTSLHATLNYSKKCRRNVVRASEHIAVEVRRKCMQPNQRKSCFFSCCLTLLRFFLFVHPHFLFRFLAEFSSFFFFPYVFSDGCGSLQLASLFSSLYLLRFSSAPRCPSSVRSVFPFLLVPFLLFVHLFTVYGAIVFRHRHNFHSPHSTFFLFRIFFRSVLWSGLSFPVCVVVFAFLHSFVCPCVLCWSPFFSRVGITLSVEQHKFLSRRWERSL